MDYPFVAQINMGRLFISISGMPLKYAWNDDIAHLKNSRQVKGFALINSSNLASIYIILDDRCVRIDVIKNIKIDDYTLFVKEDFWHAHWAIYERRGKRHKKYNEAQNPIGVVIQSISNISLTKI